jgi:hypothetical protein
MNAKEALLDIARELRQSPEKWTQLVDARDALGNEVGPWSLMAVSRCLAAHISLRLYEKDVDQWYVARKAVQDFIVDPITDWNDRPCRTVEHVISACEGAAEKL